MIDSIKYCQANKGLEVYAYCIMTSHVHMILGTEGSHKLEDIIRDFKSFTSRSTRKLLEEWTYSSAKDYYGSGKGCVDVIIIS